MGFDGAPGPSGLEAYCRHQLTNYEALLREADERFPGCSHAKNCIRERMHELIEQAIIEADLV
jgi:hypothetical protein